MSIKKQMAPLFYITEGKPIASQSKLKETGNFVQTMNRIVNSCRCESLLLVMYFFPQIYFFFHFSIKNRSRRRMKTRMSLVNTLRGLAVN